MTNLQQLQEKKRQNDLNYMNDVITYDEYRKIDSQLLVAINEEMDGTPVKKEERKRFKLVFKGSSNKAAITQFSDYNELLTFVSSHKITQYNVYDRQTKLYVLNEVHQ